MQSYVTLVNASAVPMEARFEAVFSTGRVRRDRVEVPPWETRAVKISTLFGSQVSDPTVTLTGLSVSCNGGQTPCSGLLSHVALPSCVPE